LKMNVFVRRWILGELEMVELRNKVVDIPACGGKRRVFMKTENILAIGESGQSRMNLVWDSLLWQAGKMS